MKTTIGKLDTIGDIELFGPPDGPSTVRGALITVDDVDALRRLGPLLGDDVAIVPARWARAIDEARVPSAEDGGRDE